MSDPTTNTVIGWGFFATALLLPITFGGTSTDILLWILLGKLCFIHADIEK